MTRTIFLLTSTLLASHAFGQPVVTASGVCESLMFATAHGVSRDVVWTTYTASRGFPLNKRTPTSRIHSLEFRPRANQPGVYEADYIVVSGTTVIEFGSITLNLPTQDSDTNGVPDLLQFDREVDVAITGNMNADYVRTDRVTTDNLTGTLRRAANQFEGTYTFAPFADGETVTQRFRILSYDGVVTYQRGARTSTMTRTITAHVEDAQSHTSTIQYRVLTPDKILIPAQWITVDGQRTHRYRVILNRVGNRYFFTPNNRDGDSRTPWKDYVRWIEQIVDPNDSDGDGIPDLSDPDLAH